MKEQPDTQVVGLSEFNAETQEQLDALQPDVVIIDADQPNRSDVTDTVLSCLPNVKIVGLSLERAHITVSYLQQQTGAAVEDLVSAVRSLPLDNDWATKKRQMRILAAIQGPLGQRMVDTISQYAPSHWNVSIWRAPPLMPPDKVDLVRMLPKHMAAADLVLAVAESEHFGMLLPEIAFRSGARAVVAPVENPRWYSAQTLERIQTKLNANAVAYAFPKPFCSLTMRTYNEGQWRVEYQDAHIEEFARYFGRPELRILVGEDGKVSRCEVRREMACGLARELAEALFGCDADQVEQCASSILESCACSNGLFTDFDYRVPLRQVSHSIIHEALRREMEPYLSGFGSKVQ